MGLPPDVVVEHSALWVQAASDVDPGAWGAATAAERWDVSGLVHTSEQVRGLAAQLTKLAETAFATGCSGAFFLLPDPSVGAVAVVRLLAVERDPGTTVDELARDLLLPAELELLPAQVTVLQAPCGPARRIAQRAYSEQTGAVSDYLTWAYAFDEAAWLLRVSFPQPSGTETWLPELDRLAAGVDLDRSGR